MSKHKKRKSESRLKKLLEGKEIAEVKKPDGADRAVLITESGDRIELVSFDEAILAFGDS